MTPATLLAWVLAAGGQVTTNAKGGPRLSVPRELTPPVKRHRRKLRQLVLERQKLLIAGIDKANTQRVLEVAELFGARNTPVGVWLMRPRCPVVEGCSVCGDSEPGHFYVRVPAGALCANCWKLAGRPWR